MPTDSTPSASPADPSTPTLAHPSATDSGLLLEASSADKFESTLHRDAKFWDQVANRKNKAKKRKARKFLSNQQERFSIADDLKGDDATTTEVNFYSSFTPGHSGDGHAVAGGDGSKGYSSLSDMDLIMQLAELESGVNSEDVSFHPSMVVSSNTSEGAPSGDGTPVRSVTGSKAGSKAAPTKAVSSELQVLEELERELGLDNFLTGMSNDTKANGSAATSTEASAKSASAAAAASSLLSDDDNLDELEKYLQSLGSPAGKAK